MRTRVVATVLVSALPLVAAVAVADRVLMLSAEREIDGRALTLARTAALSVDSYVTAAGAGLRTLAVAPAIRDAQRDPERASTMLDGVLVDVGRLDTLAVFDESGWNVTPVAGSVQAPPRSLFIGDREYFSAALTRDGLVVTDSLVSRTRGIPVVNLAVHVDFPGDGRGVVAGALDVAALRETLGRLDAATSPRYILLDSKGAVIAHPDQEIERSGRSLRGQPMVDRALAGGTGSMVTSETGEETLIGYSPVGDLGWVVLTVRPTAAAYGLAREQRALTIAVLAGALGLMLVGAWVGGGRLGRSYQQLADARAQADAARDRVEELSRGRDELLMTLAHDLKNPLSVVKGHVQLVGRRLAAGVVDQMEIRSRLAKVERSIRDITRLLDELGDTARLTLGEDPELHLAPTDLDATLARVVEEHEGMTDRHRFRREVSPQRLVGLWDGQQLERVVRNLVTNAVKYSPGGGEVVVGTRLEGTAPSAFAALYVRDHGIGIPPADLASVFDPYFRSRNAQERVSGLGLGLAGARRIVELHGGTIHVESRLGKGSTFTVRLPLRAVPTVGPVAQGRSEDAAESEAAEVSG